MADTKDFNDPLQPKPQKAPVIAALGSTGLKEYNGYITEEFLSQLRGREAVKTYTEMAQNDSTVAAVLYACEMLLRGVEWRVDPADDTPKAEEAKEFVEEVMQDMSHSWSAFIEEVATYLRYGYSIFEIVYKVRVGPDAKDNSQRSRYTDRRYGIRKLAPRSQDSLERWLFDREDGSLLGIEQQTETGKRAIIPMDRLLLFRTKSNKNSPEGASILRGAFVSYVRKKAVEDAEGRAALRAAGVVMLRMPGVMMSSEADAEQAAVFAAYKNLATSLSKDQQGAVILPSDRDGSGNYLYDMEFKIGDGRRSGDFSQIIDRFDKAIATSVLADFIFLGQAAVGSFALSSDKTQLFAQALGAYIKGIEEVLNRHLLPRLWELNGFDLEVMPKFKASDIENPNLTEIMTFVGELAHAGAAVFPDEDLENHLREIGKLPPKAETARVSGAGALAQAGGENGQVAASEKDIEPAKKKSAQPKPRVKRKGT